MKILAGNTFAKIALGVVIIAVIVAGGWYTFTQWPQDNTKNSSSAAKTKHDDTKPTVVSRNQESKDYTGWKTYTAKGQGLSFQYPPDWQFLETTATNDDKKKYTLITLLAPEQKDSKNQFVMEFSIGKDPTSMIYATVAGSVLSAMPVSVQGSKIALHVVTYDFNTTGYAQGMYLTDAKPVVGKASKINVISPKDRTKAIDMHASLLSRDVKKDDKDVPKFTLKQYQNNPDYPVVVKMFKSLTYKP